MAKWIPTGHGPPTDNYKLWTKHANTHTHPNDPMVLKNEQKQAYYVKELNLGRKEWQGVRSHF